MVLIIITPVYIISCFLMYKHTSIAYSKCGRWSSLKTSEADVFITFMPLLNTIGAVVNWLFFYPNRRPNHSFNKFFNINKNK